MKELTLTESVAWTTRQRGGRERGREREKKMKIGRVRTKNTWILQVIGFIE